MKISYRGVLYEENYHFSDSGYFNKQFIERVQRSAKEFALAVYKIIRSNEYENRKFYKIPLTDPILPYVFFIGNYSEHIAMGEIKEGYYITLNDSIIQAKDIDDESWVLLLHEFIHIYREVFAKNKKTDIDKSSDIKEIFKDPNKPNYFQYYNSPEEISAYIGSIISYIISSKNRLEYFKGLSFEDFYKACMNLTGNEKQFDEYLDKDNKNKVYEVIRLLYAKVQQGYF